MKRRIDRLVEHSRIDERRADRNAGKTARDGFDVRRGG
jgi:hypothetical protein